MMQCACWEVGRLFFWKFGGEVELFFVGRRVSVKERKEKQQDFGWKIAA